MNISREILKKSHRLRNTVILSKKPEVSDV